MEFSEVINKRRSVRAFTGQTVDEKIIKQILEEGSRAPSAGNIRSWEYIVVQDKSDREKIVSTTYIGSDSESRITQKWILEAPIIILLACDRERYYAKYKDKGVNKYIYLDGAACMENMLLSAVNLGLGACYIGGFRDEELSMALNMPTRYEIIGFMPVGYADMNKCKIPQKNNEILV